MPGIDAVKLPGDIAPSTPARRLSSRGRFSGGQVDVLFLCIGLAFATVAWLRPMIWIIVYLTAVAVLYLAIPWIAVDDEERPD